MTPKPLVYDHSPVANTQRTRPDVDAPNTVAAFLRALYYALDEGPSAQRCGVVR